MGRTVKSEKIRKEFLAELKDSSEKSGCVFIDRFSRREIYLVAKKDKLYVVFVKVSTSKKGFWGLPEKWLNHYTEMLKSKKPDQVYDRVIILLKFPRRGYLLKGDEFDELKPSLSFSKGQYIINEGNHLDSKFGFLGLDDVSKRLGLEE